MISIDHLRNDLLGLVQQFDTWGVFRKLLFNESLNQNGVSPEGVLRMLGWVHLYTASGIHIYALLEGMNRFLVQTSWSNRRGFPVLRLAILWSLGIVLFGVWFLQKFRFGFLRPLLMFGLRQFGKALGLKWTLLAPLFITLGFDLIIGSFENRSGASGRLHYYLAVGGGILALECFKSRAKNTSRRFSRFSEHAVLAWGSWIAIAVVELFEDHHVALWTPLLSLLTLPLFCGLFYPLLVLGLILATFGYAKPLIFFGTASTHFLTRLIQGMDGFGMSFYFVDGSAICSAALFAAVGSGMWIYFKSLHLKFLSFIVLVLCALLAQPWIKSKAMSHETHVVQVDVKQGDALLVQNNRNEMIDVGGKKGKSPEAWLSEFSRRGTEELDGVLLSHLDEDHQGALRWLSVLIPIHCIETHGELWSSEKGKVLARLWVDRQKSIHIKSEGCVHLSENFWLKNGKHGKGNELMVGSVIRMNSSTVYLGAGDADEAQEREFWNWAKPRVATYPNRIWKVNHHGSRFSSNDEVLREVHPQEAWVSVGKRNPYHHPHPSVIFKFLEQNVRLKRTDNEGDLTWQYEDRSDQKNPLERFLTSNSQAVSYQK